MFDGPPRRKFACGFGEFQAFDSSIRPIVNPWEEEYRKISAVAQKPTGSSTSKLLADSNEICQKVGEESAEFVRAFTQETGIPEEFNGVVYALMVAAAKLQVPWQEIEADLKSRWS